MDEKYFINDVLEPFARNAVIRYPGIDTGQPQSDAGTDNEGVKYVETYTITCSGNYKGGKLTYIQTFNDFNKGERGVPWRELRGGSAATFT